MSNHRTPLRYPGGKQKLSPFILEIIEKNNLRGCDYVEPYAGGAGIALDLLIRGDVNHIHLNDASFQVYAFWKSIIDSPDEFCHLISTASLTVDEWKRQRDIMRNPDNEGILSVGFSTFFLNRCNRSGVLSGGLIGGIEQHGEWKMDARFPRNELIRRIELISTKRDCISLSNMDAETFILEYLPNTPQNTVVYCDPPYFHKSRGLYLNQYKPADHAQIAKVIQNNLCRRWIVSYDNVDEIRQYYNQRKVFVYNLQYNAARAYVGQEIFIFSDSINLPNSSVLPYISTALHEIPLPVGTDRSLQTTGF